MSGALDVELHSGMLGAIDCARVLLGRDLEPDEASALYGAYREAAKTGPVTLGRMLQAADSVHRAV